MKQWTGTIIKESLADTQFLKMVKINKTRKVHLDNPAPGQPSIWHLHTVTVEDGAINSVCEKTKYSINEGPWYVDFKSSEKIIVIFKNKIFKTKKGDTQEIIKIKEYGRSMGIPEKQLDFNKT